MLHSLCGYRAFGEDSQSCRPQTLAWNSSSGGLWVVETCPCLTLASHCWNLLWMCRITCKLWFFWFRKISCGWEHRWIIQARSVFVWKPWILQGVVLFLLQLFLSLWSSQQGRSWHHPGNLHVISLRKNDSLSVFCLILVLWSLCFGDKCKFITLKYSP